MEALSVLFLGDWGSRDQTTVDKNAGTKFWGEYNFLGIVPGRHFDDVII